MQSRSGGEFYEKSAFLDRSICGDDAGIALDDGYVRKRRRGDGHLFCAVFALNPIYAICVGAAAGRDGRKLWALPVITALLFLIGTWLFFDWREKAFVLYALIYLFLGIAAMLISMFIKKKRK